MSGGDSRDPRPGGRRGVLQRAYRRLGPRYPIAVLAALMLLEALIVVIGIVVLALYVRISLGEFALLAFAAVAWQGFYAVLTLRRLSRDLVPLVEWLEGTPGERGAREAWTVAASLPLELLRIWWRGGYPIIAGLGWSIFAVWLLGLPAWAVPVLFLAAQALLAYGNGVPFFIMERALQPLHDDLAAHLSEEAEGEALSLPLRRRLLGAVLAISAGTGIVAVGLLESGHPGLGELGLATLASVGISLTVLLPFTLLLAGSVVAPIHRLQEATARIGAGDLSVRVPVTANDEAGALTRAFNRMASGLEERERLREAFGTFVDPDLTERVLEEGTDLAGEEVEVSLLFMDIRGFTTYSEEADAKEVVARLNDLYGEVVPLITSCGGHANKFIGDGLLAVFGAPDRLSDHADRAVAAGIAIARMVRERYRGELRVGIGVNSGRVVVGTIGGGGRLDFTVIGDPVNTAARVESATRQTDDDLLITEATRRLLSGDSGGWDERPPVALKGKAREVRLYGSRALAADARGAVKV
jgi:adenylate cyclase